MAKKKRLVGDVPLKRKAVYVPPPDLPLPRPNEYFNPAGSTKGELPMWLAGLIPTWKLTPRNRWIAEEMLNRPLWLQGIDSPGSPRYMGDPRKKHA